ncbi:hypothetical protein VCRA2128O305_20080 [Vibrio crassostreae]|nr:hypothetical protein VCRA2110O173_10068 [Vibrio crassostreae]CAK1878167.1 hypothetical protein VCRA2110O175_10462 [Vibrio crassostreae]CAK1879154.1 hypothetical protein VCRA2113O221_10453 [Vibrio crassostreae]CAK1886405.1 hypothetical protein VCRA2113O231_10475 [Vibrio crassostreae]CAK1887874.1 hypothetical protein VCRA2112O191_10475 [Vibrio crassostreae]
MLAKAQKQSPVIDSLGFLFLGYGTVNCCQPLSVSEPTY